MIDDYENLAIAVVPLYVLIFHLVTYFSLPDLWNMKPHLHKSWDKIFQAGLRGEQVSFALTGFAIIGLVFIMSLTFDDLSDAELIIVFFTFGFILEMFSAFMYHMFEKFGYQMSAGILQYGGLFAILLGFFTYFIDIMEWSVYIKVLYLIGLAGFIILSAKELHAYIRYEAKKELGE